MHWHWGLIRKIIICLRKWIYKAKARLGQLCMASKCSLKWNIKIDSNNREVLK